MKTKILSKSNNKFIVDLSDESYLFIEKLVLVGKQAAINDAMHGLKLRYELHQKSGIITSKKEIFNFAQDTQFKTAENTYTINEFISDSNNSKYQKIFLIFEYTSDNEGVELEITYSRTNYIDIQNPWENFKIHLEEPFNSKILFSAPFGQGKTTFLNKFFDDNKDAYEVFHIYPVNYSVAHNEDIFQYIKVELLLQLLEKEVVFDKEEFSKNLTGFEFAKEHIDEILMPFLHLIPKVGSSIYNVITPLNKLRKQFLDFHEEAQITDKKSSEYFIKEYYEKEGSLFENNFFTQLIRQLVEQLKQPQKRTVLIVDDIDRMDPEHIFRILNVFAAHFDSEYKDEEGSNKFGFDIVILVCDYSNLRHIFRHKYGPHTDFKGYIDKFSSRGIFNYNNSDAVVEKLKGLIIDKRTNIYFHSIELLKTIINDLIRTDNLSLREIIKLEKEDFSYIISKQRRKGIMTSNLSQNNDFYATNSLMHIDIFNYFHFLAKLTDIDTLIDKFIICKQKVSKSEVFINSIYHRLGLDVLIAAKFNDRAIEGIHSFEFDNGTKIHFSYSVSENTSYEVTYKIEGKSIKFYNKDYKSIEYEINTKDFYTLVIAAAKKYKEVGGLYGFER